METMEKRTMEMTAEEMAEFQAFRAAKRKKEAEAKAKEQREEYRNLVDDEIEAAIPALQCLSEDIRATKQTVMENFRTILQMKSEVLNLTKDDQRSHTFTNSEGNKRITLGVYTTDGYRDTVEDGIKIVKEYIESLVKDEKSRSLVNMVLKLLSKDSKGTLKASRVIQLRKIADDTGDEQFMRGVQIIEESYLPSVSKQYIKAEVKDENGAWKSIPLGMTEA